MRALIWLTTIPLLFLAGCSGGVVERSGSVPTSEPPSSRVASVGASVPRDDPTLARADSAGNTPEDVLLAYVRAADRADWRTVYSLSASPTGSYRDFAELRSADAVPWDDFKMYETRIVSPNRALVRVTYSTIGFSALEEQTPEQARRVIVVKPPGEWWVLERGNEDDAVWKVTPKGPND